jgi:hypothetical protein
VTGLVDHDGVDQAALLIDGDGDGGPVPETSDLAFAVDDESVQRVWRGDGGGGAIEDGQAQGLRTAVAFTDGRWSAELRVDGKLLALSATPRIRVAHTWKDKDKGSGEAAWPAGSAAGSPASWGLATFGDGPPTVTVPRDMVVPAAGPDGAVVTWKVTVDDDEDPAPTVACVPKSGSVFAIGTTTVTCTGRDASGNQAVATFTVTVESTARSDRQAVRRDLAAMRPAGDARTDALLLIAVAFLDASLLPDHWVSGDRLDPATGRLVFDADIAAVVALRLILAPPPAILAAVARLVDVDAGLADTAIGDAEAALVDHAGGDPALLQKAASELARARKELEAGSRDAAEGKPAQAIYRYREAWLRAQRAIAYARGA